MKHFRFLTEAWLVLLLAAVFGGTLAGVNISLRGRIAANRKAETEGQVPKMVPGAVDGEPCRIGDDWLVYRALDTEGNTVGWVLPASGQGFADRIELLVAIDRAGASITSVYVLEQKETPGLGSRITEEEWRRQFAGKPAAELTLTRTEPAENKEIEAITGATISAESVVEIVNRTITRFGKTDAAEEQ